MTPPPPGDAANGDQIPRLLQWGKWAAAGAAASLEFLQKFTPALDFLPRWTSLAISYLGTAVVLIGAVWVAVFLWRRSGVRWRRGAAIAAFLRRWRAMWWCAGAVAVVLLAYGFSGWYYAWKFGWLGKPDTSTVAVFAFDAAGYGAREIGLDVAAQLTSLLDGAGGLRTVNARRVAYNYTGARSELYLDSIWGNRIAHRVGAGLFVTGTVNLVGKRVALSARLYEVSTGKRIARVGRLAEVRRVAEVSEAGDTADLPALTDRLAIGLVSQYRYQRGARPLLRGAASAPGSVRDLNVYLRAEDAVRRGDFVAAAQMLEPLDERPAPFAPANYGVVVADLWNDRTDHAERTIAHALAHASGLAQRDSILLRGMAASLQGQRDSAQHHLGQLLWRFGRDDPEADYLLGELFFRTNPHVGLSRGQAQEHFHAVLSVDSLHFRARWHVLMLALAAGEDSVAYHHASRALEGGPDSARAGALELLKECLADWRNPRCPADLLDSAAVSPQRSGMALGFFFARWRVQPDGPWQAPLNGLLERMRQSSDRGTRQIAWRTTADVAVARGWWGGGRRALDSLAAHQAAMARGVLVTLPFVHATAADLDSTRQVLEDWRVSVPPLPTTYIAARPAIRDFLLGMVRLRSGARDSAAAAAGRLGREPWRTGERWPEISSQLSRTLGIALRSELALERGTRREALALLTRIDLVPAFSVRDHPIYAHDRERYRRAELLYRLGRREEALLWFVSLRESSTTAVYDAPASYWMGRIAEEAKQVDKAKEHYRHVLALWTGCDPHFPRWRDEALDRLAALGEKPSASRCPSTPAARRPISPRVSR